jgi:ABC-type branched-subunit amino acid transport system ATPase component
MKLELRKFDVTKLRDDSVVLFIGPRNTGKTTNLLSVLSHHTNIPIGVVISGTEGANHTFEKLVPKMLIYEDYDTSIVNKFLDRQKQIMNQVNLEKKK